ncbi:glycoside hydrolase family 31 protein [Microvirga brassicacearum]|uniref:Glycoside hydrolase family 31 protein n=1 Tax=Microvirga brassicacearum TaxID=2580413 RepID=A0A5N3P5D8_9HYPH|nr:TIM-barrel domain-containing protein [Microvirga brassicacearum]KAB0264915.1 glycoside hydrolase family 31 protein [Microvirga brassicacearum]
MSDTLPRSVMRLQGHFRPISIGRRAPEGSWTTTPFDEELPGVEVSVDESGRRFHLVVALPEAAAIDVTFAVPRTFQAFGGGERFETLNLKGQSVRYYLENFGLGNGTYLPSPWIVTTLGYGIYLPDEAPAVFHIASPFDPNVFRVQVEGNRLEMSIHLGDLEELYRALIDEIGPPLMPADSFFSLWKAGDWRIENAATVAADRAGHRSLGLPMGVKLIDAYWASEVHSFAFDTEKYPDAWGMVSEMAEEGTGTYLWLCPWVVVGTRSFQYAKEHGYVIVDHKNELITRRPGANPNVLAALIDFSNRDARDWWSRNLRNLLARGIEGFKVDFGEQLPEHAVLKSGETGGRAHNAFVRYYLEATIDSFDGKTPAIISRSGSPRVRAPIWSGDQTSDFCPKTGLPSAIRAVQSASLAGWSFIGSDLGGYFGTPTAQVFARWTQFSCFSPLMMLHGLGCREPWDMDEGSQEIYRHFARLHLALLPLFQIYGREAAAGGLPMIRMMPLAFPGVDWTTINDWDQQYLLGHDLLVAPVAFYGNTRAVYLPPGHWYDVLASEWVTGPCWRVHDVPLNAIPLFVRDGGRIVLTTDADQKHAALLLFEGPAQSDAVQRQSPERIPEWKIKLTGRVGTTKSVTDAPENRTNRQLEIEAWFGNDIVWSSPA